MRQTLAPQNSVDYHVKVHPGFFLVRIPKQLQKEKRSKLTVSNIGYLGINHSEIQGRFPGFHIASVQKNSPAYEAGFQYGDIITAINGKRVTGFTDMIAAVQKSGPGQKVYITYINAFLMNPDVAVKTVTLAEKPLALDVPDGTQDMRFNLQFGQIVEIGEKAAAIFPVAKPGDTLILHHSVEYKQRGEGDNNWNDWHLIDDDKDYEYRIAHAQKEVLGIWKIEDSTIIPFPTYVFCHASFQKASMQMIGNIWVPDQWQATVEEYETKLQTLKDQVEELNTSSIMKKKDDEQTYQKKEHIKAATAAMNKERREITRLMSKKRLVETTVLYVNEETNVLHGNSETVIEVGDKIVTDYAGLYPLDLFGVHYVLVKSSMIELIIKSNMEKSLKPYYDRVVVRPDAAEEKSAGGIIIPDTAQEKPARGVIVAVGPGEAKEPMQPEVNDKVMYSKMSGTEIEHEGEKLLVMRAGEILTGYY